MLSSWNIHYHRWVIDDGEPEREAGERFQWRILGYGSADGLTATTESKLCAIEEPDYSYHVVAKVIHASSKASVIDFGLTAVGSRDLLPNASQVGEYVTGRIALFFEHSIDPVRQHIIESMTHEWTVEEVFADLTPYRSIDSSGRRLIRCAQRVSYEQIVSTREKNANSYVLRCSLAPFGTTFQAGR